MKNILLWSLFSLLFTCSQNLFAMKVYEGDLKIDSQLGIDTFSYNKVTGTLWIESPYITNLHGLSSLQRVNNLILAHDTALTSLQGLENLQVVEGNFDLHDTEHIQNLNALSGLDSVYGTLEARYNFSLTDISGLSNLRSAGSIHFFYNVELPSLNGFYQLNKAGSIYISDCHKLADIDGLANLAEADIISLSNNYLLEDICAIAHLSGSGTAIYLEGNASNDFSGCITGLDLSKNPLKLYPNPFSSHLSISYIEEETELIIYTTTGETVFRKTISIATEKLDLTELYSGVYFIELKSRNGKQIRKVIKN